MADFQAFDATTHPIVRLENDYNNILAHGLEKCASYIFRKNGAYYEAIKEWSSSGAGTISFGGVDNAGATDGTSAADTLNAAIAALTTGGAIFAPKDVYSFDDQIVDDNSVNLIGESMGAFDDFTLGTVFQDTGAGATPFVDYRDSRHVNIRNIKFYLNGGASTSGIRIGGEHNDSDRTKCSQWSNVVVDGFATGILGDTWGPDDTNFLNCYVGNASTVAVDHLSSQCKFFGGTFYTSEIGVRITRNIGAFPDASMLFYGTVWSDVAKCVTVTGDGNPRATSFVGAWFEDVDDYILRINDSTAADVGHFHFNNCYGYVNTGGNIFELGGVSCRLQWIGGELYPQTSTTDIVTDGAGATVQKIRIQTPTGVERIAFNDSNSGLAGWDRHYLLLFEDVTGHSTGTTAAAWNTWGYDHDCPFRQNKCVKAKVYFSWNPESVSGGIRLAYPAATPIPGTQTVPGAAGLRTDTVTVTPDFTWDTMGEDGHIVLEGYGDGAQDPTVYQVAMIYEI